MSAKMIHIADRLMANSVPVTESGCWLWTASCARRGYGQTTMLRKVISAHRASYLTFVGPIPVGLFVCHKCDTPACINPGHLFVGTALQNTSDMVEKGRKAVVPRKTHCIHGHEFTSGNTYLPIRRGGRTQSCRACNSLAVAARRRRIGAQS